MDSGCLRNEAENFRGRKNPRALRAFPAAAAKNPNKHSKNIIEQVFGFEHKVENIFELKVELNSNTMWKNKIELTLEFEQAFLFLCSCEIRMCALRAEQAMRLFEQAC